MKRFIAVLATAATMMISGAAFAAGPQGPPPPDGPRGPRPEGPSRGGLPPEALAKFLKLTEAQKASADSLHTTLEATVRPLAEQVRAIHDKSAQAVQSGADASAIGQLVLQAHALEVQIRAAHETFDASFTALLNDEQKARFAIYKEIQELQRPPEPPAGSSSRR